MQSNNMDEITKDKRFSHIISDPRFRRIPKGERKVKIDKRFQSMFNDDKFKLKYTVDKRGRPVNYSTNEDLKKYYDISSEDENDSKEKEDTETVGRYVKLPSDLTEHNPNDESLSDGIKKKIRDSKIDYARGEGKLLSDSSSDDDESNEESDDEGVEHDWGELDKDADVTDEVTYRLAACNMDWDRIRALDLMVLFNSFLPSGGFVKSVKIYPSEFGLQRMKEEEVKGPLELVHDGVTDENDIKDNETEEGSKYHMEKLRQYQLNRLKYYYAIIDFDSPASANKVYSECDRLEYESSATRLDLRFVPDDMVFEQEPKEECDKLPEMSKYQPRCFTTTALQQAKVELTWDEMNPDRVDFNKKINSGKIEDISESDLQAYLAVSSDDESEDEQKLDSHSEEDENIHDPINKYRALIENIEKSEEEKKNRDVEMEFTWGVNLKQKTESLVKKKLAENSTLTPFEQYLEKKKEKKKQKKAERMKKIKQNDSLNCSTNSDDEIPSDIDMNDPYFAEEFNNAEFKQKKKTTNTAIEVLRNDEEENRKQEELELLLLNEENDNRKHFSVKQLEKNEKASKSKRWKKKTKKDQIVEDNFEMNVKDDRFSALFSSHHFNIDPADPHFKKTKGMEALIEEKLKRRTTAAEGHPSPLKIKKSKEKEDIYNKKLISAELNVLVKSVKRKTESLKKK